MRRFKGIQGNFRGFTQENGAFSRIVKEICKNQGQGGIFRAIFLDSNDFLQRNGYRRLMQHSRKVYSQKFQQNSPNRFEKCAFLPLGILRDFARKTMHFQGLSRKSAKIRVKAAFLGHYFWIQTIFCGEIYIADRCSIVERCIHSSFSKIHRTVFSRNVRFL